MAHLRPRLTDRDVRAAVHEQLVPGLVGKTASRVLDEFQVCLGEGRVDIAVVNGKLHGIEIKSEADTLDRLAGQRDLYNRVFDTVTVVCGSNHVDGVSSRVPVWWGIYSAAASRSGVRLKRIRSVGRNPNVNAEALAQFLWKDEIIRLLAEAGVRKGLSGKTRRALWPVLASAYPLEVLQEKVRECLKAREDWRPAVPLT